MLKAGKKRSRLLAVTSALCALVFATVGVMLTAGASPYIPSFEQKLAEATAGSDIYSYMVSESFSQPYRTIVQHNRSDEAYNSEILGWRNASLGTTEKRTAADEAYLFDLLASSYIFTNHNTDPGLRIMATRASVLTSIMTESNILPSDTVSELQDGNKNLLKQRLSQCDELSTVTGVMQGYDLVDACTTDVNTLVKALCEAEAILTLCDEMTTALDNARTALIIQDNPSAA